MDGDERAGAATGGPATGNRRRSMPARTRRTGRRPSRFRRLRPGPGTRGFLLRGVLSIVALGTAGATVAALATLASPLPEPAESLASQAAAAVPAALPPVPAPEQRANLAVVPQLKDTARSQDRPQRRDRPQPQRSFAGWASEMAAVTGIPARALQAYANAHAVVAETQPDCRLTWVTLAGVARVESDHGQYRNRTLGEDGRPSSPIIGVPLDGSPRVRAIGDTDGGALDGDRRWDRAVGPFQFIPSTWARWRSDGDGDGVGEPQDIDDSAVAAARYLCAGSRDLASGDGWLGAVLSYNNSMSYAQQVYSNAEGYAQRARS
jgi:membrane-bound lytic murein transglycosylase B